MRARILSLCHCPIAREHHQHGDKVDASIINLTPVLGMRDLGCRRVTLAPGCHAWPFHFHHNNDEMFVVLKGKGSVRLGDKRYPIVEGELIAAPAADPDCAHQIINDSDEPLTYLCISSMNAPDVTEYPDSGKFQVVTGSAPGGDKASRGFEHTGLRKDTVDYWQDED